MTATVRLWGIGLGPGDPELVTVKAARVIGAVDVIAYHSARHGRSIARALAEPYLRGDQLEEILVYPVTVEETEHPGGYQGAIDEFYAECAARLAAHLDAGRTVAVLAEGDPFFYSSYMHMHKRLAHRYPTEVIPGVTSVSAAAAVLGRPLVERDEVLTVLPGTLPADVLAAQLAGTDSAAIMKLGRTFGAVRQALTDAGRLDDAWFVERATTERQRIQPFRDVDPATVPYFSLALLPSPREQLPVPPRTVPPATAAAGASADEHTDTVAERTAPGEVVVVGLGPAGPQWLTPEAAEALATADDLVGYGPYVARVPVTGKQRVHASGNQVEAVRAAFALDLAKSGRRVAVVSSGDPGVFAMASAVLEVASEPAWRDVPVRILPGLTAAQAVASRVGAPLGHDYCVLSLSDRLKPWHIIEQRLDAAGAADLAIAIYNPASTTRRWQVGAARDILLRHRKSTTPVVIGRDIGGVEESVRIVALGDLDPADVDMRCLLLIGSSQTQVVARGDGSVVFTPRTYPT